MKNILSVLVILTLALTTGFWQKANAQDSAQELPIITTTTTDSSPSADDSTHPAIYLTPDKSELMKLDDHVASVLVGNPLHLSVMAESTKLLVLVGKAPGASYFTALNKDGEVIMQRHVIIAAPKQNYVRVRKACALSPDPDKCTSTNMYYCPEGLCHDVLIDMSEADGEIGAVNKGADNTTSEGNGGNGE